MQFLLVEVVPFLLDLQYNLTNGESYSSNDVSGSMTGSYFASPYKYNLIVGCFVVDGSAVPGIYTFTLTDSYGDGWQGSYISLSLSMVLKNKSVFQAIGEVHMVYL